MHELTHAHVIQRPQIRLIDAKLSLTELYWLVAYPIMLLYACFVIITVF
jgi:hypothetical protein